LLVAVSAGFHYRSQATPGTAPANFNTLAPQYINVYETKANIPVAVHINLAQEEVELYQIALQAEGYTDFYAGVTVTVSPPPSVSPGIIMMTSNVAPVPFPGENPAYTKITNGFGESKFAVQLPLTRNTDGTWIGGALFRIPIIFASHGSIYGHLPSVGTFEHPEGGIPPLFAEYAGATGKLRSATMEDIGNSPNANMFDPSSLVTIRGDHGALFYGPGQMSYTEALDKIAPVLAGNLVDYMTPVESIVDGGSDYEWPSLGVQEPIFKYTEPDSVDSQNQASFYAGIAFGVAGSAAIALVQEISADPEKRKRKSRSPRSHVDGLRPKP
jgi:hypothetical protein